MTFDDNISETVSLSKILDCFIEDGETPSVILNFLTQYKSNEIVDIFVSSRCYNRIFQIDFLGKCNGYDIMKLYSITEECANYSRFDEVMIRFCWKVMQSNVDNNTKSMFKSILDRYLPKTSLSHLGYSFKHPYGGIDGSCVSEVEEIFKDIKTTPEDIASYFSSMKVSGLVWYFNRSNNSLFLDRILEDDVFSLFDFRSQYIMISTLTNGKYNIGYKFALSILERNIDPNLKKMIYDNARENSYDYEFSNSSVLNLIEESESYEELIMNVNLYGVDEIAREVIMALIFINPKMLMEMYEKDPEIIKEHYDICDLLEILKSGRQ